MTEARAHRIREEAKRLNATFRNAGYPPLPDSHELSTWATPPTATAPGHHGETRGAEGLPSANEISVIHRAMDSTLNRLGELGVGDLATRIPSSEFWNLTRPYLGQGRLQTHARVKPHGYPGDYEMLQMVCDGTRFGDGLSWIFDDYFQAQSAPTAVRNRVDLIATRMSDFLSVRDQETVSICSIGSGPAAEIAQVAKRRAEDRDRMRVRLLDIDPHALQAAKLRLQTWLTDPQLTMNRVNLKRLERATKRNPDLLTGDFVYCVGYFDYLSDDESAQMLRLFWTSLRPGGKLLVFNFSTFNPSRAYMEWIGNWYLLHRTRDQMVAIADAAGIPRNAVRVETEPAGVNLFLEATK